MRIGIDVRSIHTGGASSGRGIGRYVTDLILGLLEFAPENEYILFARTGKALPARLESVESQFTRIDIPGQMWHDSAGPWWQRIPRVRHNPRLLKKWSDELREVQTAGMEKAVQDSGVDILHLPSALEISSYPEGKFNCPVVMTFLDSIILEYREFFFDQWPAYRQEFFRDQLENLKTAAHIVTISDAGKSDLVEISNLSPNKITTVYPVVSDVFANRSGNSEALLSDTEGLNGRPYFLFNSVPDPHKNPYRVLRGFSEAKLPPNVALVMIIPKDGFYDRNLLQLARDRGIEDRLVITGFLPDDQMITLYQNAIALVSPSLMEGFGLPVAQSMKAGVPVITSNRSAQAEIAGGAGILVTPESVPEIASAIKTLFADSELRAKLGGTGKLLAEKFSAAEQAKRLIDVYQTLLKN